MQKKDGKRTSKANSLQSSKIDIQPVVEKEDVSQVFAVTYVPCEVQDDILARQRRPVRVVDDVVLIFTDNMMQYIVDSWEGKPQMKTVFTEEIQTVNHEEPEKKEVTDEELKPKSELVFQPNKKSKQKEKGGLDEKGLESKTSAIFSLKQTKMKSLQKLPPETNHDVNVPNFDFEEYTEGESEQTSESSHILDWRINVIDEDVTITFKQGNTYEGRVSEKFMEGQGTFTWSDGSYYVGDFDNGQITGRGYLQWNNVHWYEGEFHNGYRHGKGLYVSPEGYTYIGAWFMGHKHGQGILYYSNDFKNYYDGDWIMDIRHGEGIRRYPSGAYYVGEWRNGLRHGIGTMVWHQNHLYRGHWKCGIMHGYGEYTWSAFLNREFAFPMENIYKGNWVHGMRHGGGTLDFAAGGCYRGSWKNNLKHGPGTVFCNDGELESGRILFCNDRPITNNQDGNIGVDVNKEYECRKGLQHLDSITEYCLQDGSTTEVSKIHSSLDVVMSKILMCCNANETRSSEEKTHTSPKRILVHAPGYSINLDYYIERLLKPKRKELENNSKTDNTVKDLPSEGDPIPEMSNNKELVTVSQTNKLKEKKMNKTLPRKPKPESSVRKRGTKQSEATVKSCADLKTAADVVETENTDPLVAEFQYEQKWINYAIQKNITKLRDLYFKYATIGCNVKPDYKSILVRIMLWQMFRDCEIHTRNISLVEVDVLVAENPKSRIGNPHDPFERLYFWQFLHYLLDLSWILYASKNIGKENTQGVLGSAFQKLLLEDLFPNVDRCNGCVLFDKRDLLPFSAVHLLYKSLGEALTAREFLNHICFMNEKYPSELRNTQQFLPQYPNHILEGKNVVGVGGDLLFLPGDEPLAYAITSTEILKGLHDAQVPMLTDMTSMHMATATGVVNSLASICPGIKSEEGLLYNMKYPLTFLEFFEATLLCAELSLKNEAIKRERLAAIEKRKMALAAKNAKRDSRSSTTLASRGAKKKKKK